MSFNKLLTSLWKQNNYLCVGLDTDLDKIPSHFPKQKSAIFEFNKEIIDATHDLVCAYKPQIAYYAAQGAEDELKMTIEYIHSNYPQIPVILDSKRSDIGATAEKYAAESFIRYEADAVTVNPYMGWDSIEPFAKYENKGVFILCKTSNPSSGDIQDLETGSTRVSDVVAKNSNELWNKFNNIGIVVGGTYPEEIKRLRKSCPNLPFLVPGIGKQGGDINSCLSSGLTNNQQGLVLNSSRGIIYKESSKNFALAARTECLNFKELVDRHLSKQPSN